MTTTKKIITAAIAALALTTASLVSMGDAFANGGQGGHVRGHGSGHYSSGYHGDGQYGSGHYFNGHHFGYSHNSCWKWTPYGSINVCASY